MDRHQRSVNDFMSRAGQQLPTSPTMPDINVRRLRAALILEEAVETVKALGFEIQVSGEVEYEEGVGAITFSVAKRSGGYPHIHLEPVFEPSLVEIIDGCCDTHVVTTGTLSACGIDESTFQDIINESNLAKFGPGGYRRDDGKWIKPPDWKKPDIAGAIAREEKLATVVDEVNWLPPGKF